MNKIFINVDGGSRNNPGQAAIGVVFSNEKGDSIKEYSEYLGDGITNNEAEYRAAIISLQKLKQFLGKELAKKSNVELRSDSEFLVKQLKGEYKVEQPHIQQLFLELWNMLVELPNIKLRHVPRTKNVRADQLVNAELDKQAAAQNLL